MRSIAAVFSWLVATAAVAAPPSELSCRGEAPSWSLTLSGSSGTLTRGDDAPLALEGQLRETTGERAAVFVFRGRGSGEDLVATITSEACGAAKAPYTARVSLVSGELLVGCCSSKQELREAPAPQTDASAASSDPRPKAPASLPGPAGEITELVLPGGQVCRGARRGATMSFEGLRLNWDCGVTAGDRVVLLGPLVAGPDHLLTIQKGLIEWRDGYAPRKVETTPVRVAAVKFADGLACREAGKGGTLAFEGRRASFTCGIREGDTIALLGELEPDEGGFRIDRARLASGAAGFELRSSETILIAAPR